jgi:hypothetical protein
MENLFETSRGNKQNNIKESDIVKQIIEYLVRKGHYAWRDRQYRAKPNINTGSNGVADILGISKTGKFFAIEVKKPGGSVSEKQIKFMGEIIKRGQIGIFAYCLEDVMEAL